MINQEEQIYRLAEQVANKMREDGFYDREKVKKMVELADRVGIDIYFDDEYIGVGDELFRFFPVGD